MRWMFFGLAMLCLAAGATAQTKNNAVAVVNFRKVVTSHPKAARLESELRALSERANKELKAKDDDLVSVEKEIRQTTKDGLTADGKMKTATTQRLLELQQRSLEVQESAVQIRAGVSQAIGRRRAEELPRIAAEILEFVRAANNGKYALVMDSSALSPEGFPQVLDYPGAEDLTDKVIALLPKEIKEPAESRERK